jgi:hypothetical protein
MKVKYLTIILTLFLFTFCKNSNDNFHYLPNTNNLIYRFIEGDSTDVAYYCNLQNQQLFSIKYYKSGQAKEYCVYFEADTVVELDSVTLEEKTSPHWRENAA